MEIKYQTINSGWGLTASAEGQRLVFSGALNSAWGAGVIWQKIWPVAKPVPKQNPGSMVQNLDLYGLFSPSAKLVWHNACSLAKKHKAEVGLEDIFLALLQSPSIKNLLARLEANTEAAQKLLKNYLKLTPYSNSAIAKKIPFEAFVLSTKLHNHKIGSIMLLGSLLHITPQDNILQAIFANIGLTEEKLKILAVWILNLNFEFPKHSTAAKLLYCCRQAQTLEEHFGYTYKFPAIETAVLLSSKQTLKDLEHKQALQYLVKAGLLAKKKKSKIITEDLVQQAAKISS